MSSGTPTACASNWTNSLSASGFLMVSRFVTTKSVMMVLSGSARKRAMNALLRTATRKTFAIVRVSTRFSGPATPIRSVTTRSLSVLGSGGGQVRQRRRGEVADVPALAAVAHSRR